MYLVGETTRPADSTRQGSSGYDFSYKTVRFVTNYCYNMYYFNNIVCRVLTVSYTHLDVYKRQVQR